MHKTQPPPLVIASLSHVGMVRETNQDSYLVVEPQDPRVIDARGSLIVVADGMGGGAAGDLASQLVVQTIHDAYYAHIEGNIDDALEAAIRKANHQVYQRSVEHPELRGMGSTCTALVLHDSVAHIGHVGDTRAYLIRGRVIEQVTQDHSKVAQLLQDGLLTPEEAANHPDRNVILRSLGPKPEVEVAIYPPFQIRQGDIFVMCSDGLSGHLSEPELLNVALNHEPEAAAARYIEMANARGGSDNITVHVVQIGARDNSIKRSGRRAPPTRINVRAMEDEPPNKSGWPLVLLITSILICGIGIGFVIALIGYGSFSGAWDSAQGTPDTGVESRVEETTPDGDRVVPRPSGKRRPDQKADDEPRQKKRREGQGKSERDAQRQGRTDKKRLTEGAPDKKAAPSQADDAPPPLDQRESRRTTPVDVKPVKRTKPCDKPCQTYRTSWSAGTPQHNRAFKAMKEQQHLCENMRVAIAQALGRPPDDKWRSLIPYIAEYQRFELALPEKEVVGYPGKKTIKALLGKELDDAKAVFCDR